MSFKQYLLDQLPIQLAKKKQLIAEDGATQADEVSLAEVLGGYAGKRILVTEIPAPAHKVSKDTGLHVSGSHLDSYLGFPFEENYIRIQSGQPFLAEDGSASPELGPMVEELSQKFTAGYRHFFDDSSGKGWTRLNQLLEIHCPYKDTHPVDIVLAIVLAEGRSSQMAQKLRKDQTSQLTHGDYLEDVWYLQGLLSAVIPAVYRKLYLGKGPIESTATGYSRRFAASFGIHTTEAELDRMERAFDLLFLLMSYHGPGNASTNTAVAANSTLLDPWSVFNAMTSALKGVNHGGAAEMGAYQLLSLKEQFGFDATVEELTQVAYERIKLNGDPGWCAGHRKLRGPDPRKLAQAAFLDTEFPGSKLHALARRWYGQALCPQIKLHTGAKNPEENVDSLTGVTMFELGLVTELSQVPFNVCIFTLSRWAGAGTECFWKTINDRKVNDERKLSVKPALIRPSDVTLRI